MYYSDEIIEEVRRRNDIVDVISQYVRLQKKGNNYVCCCPFHNEKTPSFSVSRSKQMFYCFGCHVGGSVTAFLQQYDNMTFPEAIEFLAERAGVELPKREYSEKQKARDDKRARILAVNKETATYYYHALRVPGGKVGMDYLANVRGLSEETMQKFGLGYAPSNGAGLISYLHSKGFTDEDINNAQLGTFSEKYGMSSLFWNRVMFPIFDASGKVIAFGGRVMGEGEPKYLNSRDSDVFDKSRNLYGLNLARSSKKGYFILCEGYMDVIALHNAGYNMAVASLGTAFTPGHANLIKRYVEDVYLSYDSDGAGIKAALRAVSICRQYGISTKVIDMSPCKDPDEFMKTLGADEYEKRLKNAENGFMFRLRITERDYTMSDPDSRTKFHRAIADALTEFEEETERENYISTVAEHYGIPRDQLKALVGSRALTANNVMPVRVLTDSSHNKLKTEDGIKRNEQLLLTYLAEETYLYDKVKNYISKDDFTDKLNSEVAEKFFEKIEAGTATPASLLDLFEDPGEQSHVCELINTQLEMTETPEERSKAFKQVLLKVKQNSLAYYSQNSGSDMNALLKVVEGKKVLEQLEKMNFVIKNKAEKDGL